MKAMKVGLMGIGLICFLIWLPDTTSARTSLRISIGSNRCSGFYPGWQPSSRRYGGHYKWSHRPQYSRHRCYTCFRTPRYDLGFRRRSPRVTTFVFDYRDWDYQRPDYYIVAPSPLVIERPRVVIEKEVVVVQPEKYDEEKEKLFECLREKKSELLKKLKEENKEERKKAIDELAGFSFDDKVREALENILLSDPDPELRKQVAKVFGKVKNRKILPALEKARVEDSNEEVRKETDKAIKRIKEY